MFTKLNDSRHAHPSYCTRLIDTDNRNFWCVQMSPRTRNNGLKLYKAHCNNDVRKAFLPIALLIFGTLYLQQSFLVIMSRRLTEFNFYRFLRYT